MTVKLIEHHIAERVTAQLDHNAHAMPVRFVAQLANPLDPLVAHKLGDLFDEIGLVHLIGQFGDDQRLTLLLERFGMHPRAHQNRTAPCLISRPRT